MPTLTTIRIQLYFLIRKGGYIKRGGVNMAMSMPRISKCDVTECSYNRKNECHAMAITVGGLHPICDTFYKSNNKGGVADMIAGVGACKIETCKFNKSLECSAAGINIGHHSDHADCMTFSSRV